MSINGDKALGPDGMTSYLYHQFWPTIRESISEEVKAFFHTKTIHVRLNNTHIFVIPKIDKPEKMSDYRPISLCNASYKIIFKILTW